MSGFWWNRLAAFNENLSTAEGRSTLATSVFWQPQMRKDLSSLGECEEPELLARGPSAITPLGDIGVCGADQAPLALARSV